MDLPLSERERAIIALQVWGELPRRRREEEDDQPVWATIYDDEEE